MTASAPAHAEPNPDPELARYLATHPAPAACADAVIRDTRGNILLVEPTYKPGWDLPGGMLTDLEDPVEGLRREVLEELAVAIEVGRLLAFDTVPASVYGRTVLAFVYAAHTAGPLQAEDLVLQASEIRSARFTPVEEALTLVPAE